MRSWSDPLDSIAVWIKGATIDVVDTDACMDSGPFLAAVKCRERLLWGAQVVADQQSLNELLLSPAL